MMINPVSCTPISFRGTDVEQEDTEEGVQQQQKPHLSAAEIQNKAQEAQEAVDAFGDSVKGMTDSVTGTAATVTGSAVLLKEAFIKMIPTPIRDFFAPPVVKETLEDGTKVLEKMTGSDGVERVVRTLNKKRLGIAGGIAAVAAAALIIIPKVVKSHKAKKAHEEKMAAIELAKAQKELEA